MKNILLLGVFLLLSCGKREKNNSILFEKAESRGKVSKVLEEASGLVASKANPGYLWTLNDSGNPAEVFLLNDDAEVVLTCKLKKIENRDWEDIAIGPGPKKGVDYLYVAEIGDNDAKYNYKYLYRFSEPVLGDDNKITIEEVDTLVISLADGARDMESVAVDHSSGDFYFISKRETEVNVYAVPFHFLVDADTLILRKAISLPYFNTVAADFSFDGNELLIKTYDAVYYWKRDSSHSVLQTLLRKPTQLDYHPEPQGESIAWAMDGNGFYTLSESVKDARAHLYFYKRIK